MEHNAATEGEGVATQAYILKCQCGNRARINLDVDEQGRIPWTYWGEVPPLHVMVAVKDLVLASCVCHRRGMALKPLRIHPARSACDDRCTYATGDTCNCKCGGINHGMDA